MSLLGLLFASSTLLGPSSVYVQPDRIQGWQNDIRYFREELPKKHMNPFTILRKESFLKQTQELERSVPTLTDAQIYAGILKILAQIGDGHTTAYGGLAQQLRFWPVGVRKFSDGWFVGAHDKHLTPMVGAKVLKIGDTDIDDAVKKATTLVPHENESWVLSEAQGLLMNCDLMRGLGVLGRRNDDSMTVRMRSGEVVRVDMSNAKFPPVSADIIRQDRSKVPSIEFSRKSYGYKLIEGDSVLYLAYNRCQSDPEDPSLKFFERFWAEVDAKKPRAIIVDLRANGGGNSNIFYPFLSGLRARPEYNRYGKVYCLIGRGTFSSAMMNAIQLRQQTKALLVGEPTGGSPNSFGEVLTFELPYSKIAVSYCTKRFDLTDGKEQTVKPDVALSEPSSAYFQGADYMIDILLSSVKRKG